MSDDSENPGALKRLVQWATTPPQAYGVYLAAVALVFMLSFYAGTLKPKTAPMGEPPPAATPRN
jgi:hypothetical protein